MSFEHRAFQLAKDPERPEENQDSFAVDMATGRAAVADGVASALFSQQWAELLARAIVDTPPALPEPPGAEAVFVAWLTEHRRRWAESIDTSGLAWFQRAKLPHGAFSTLVWMDVAPADDPTSGFGAQRLSAWAVGDSCLFHVRHGELLRCFPVADVAEFERNPLAIGSVDLGRDDALRLSRLTADCYADDVIILCSDAVAELFYRSVRAGRPPAWEAFWSMDEASWRGWVDEQRHAREMRYDDATLLMLRLTAAAPVDQPAPREQGEPARPDPPDPPEAPAPDQTGKPRPVIDQISDGLDRITERSIESGKHLLDEWRKRFGKK